jgi:hypothetical protein
VGFSFQPQYDDGLPQQVDPSGGWLDTDPRFKNIATTLTDPNIFYVVLNNDPYGRGLGPFKIVPGRTELELDLIDFELSARLNFLFALAAM